RTSPAAQYLPMFETCLPSVSASGCSPASGTPEGWRPGPLRVFACIMTMVRASGGPGRSGDVLFRDASELSRGRVLRSIGFGGRMARVDSDVPPHRLAYLMALTRISKDEIAEHLNVEVSMVDRLLEKGARAEQEDVLAGRVVVPP